MYNILYYKIINIASYFRTQVQHTFIIYGEIYLFNIIVREKFITFDLNYIITKLLL